MISAVFDASMVVAACGWTAEPYRCLVLTVRRRIRSFVTEEIAAEWRATISKLEQKGAKFSRSPWPTLDVLIDLSHYVTAAPLGKQRSRDVKDDPYLACALAARAEFIISRDPDLLDLGKPFGIQIVTPREMLNLMHRLEE